jgi:long-chain fatty acid transport protein
MRERPFPHIFFLHRTGVLSLPDFFSLFLNIQTMKKICTATFAALLACTLTYGGSFQLNLQGIRQTAMGGTGVAWPWDASTIFYNPGGLSRLSGIQAYGSLNLVNPHVRFVQSPTGGYTSSTQSNMSTPFGVYVGGRLKKDSKWAAGVGVYTPFGSSAHWDNDWTGRFVVQKISLRSVFIQPTVSYAVNDMISVGAGFIYAFGGMNIDKALPLTDVHGREAQAQLEGNANGMGFNLGVQLKATEQLQFGVSYRSKVKMKVSDGTALFSLPSSVAGNFPDGGTTAFSTELPLPEILTLGVGYRVINNLTLQADVVVAGWKTYDSLIFDFNQNTPALNDSREPRLYNNTVAFRMGAHYKLGEQVAVMAGGAYDPTPTRNHLLSPDAVDANRITLSCGATYQPVTRLTIMAALNYTTTPRREATYEPANLSGAYQIKSLLPAFGISYNF